ncbi:MAG TPA: cell division protein ZipA C-terminal FtsZ-binding domain-containing protein, partial [Neisseria sp.]|nr:cell division protein ZipA C-terminal FtsZ-binding domain-containing protein [Neisseria sp.]
EEAEAIAQPAAPQAAKNDLFAEKVAAAAAAKPDAAIEVEEDDFVEPVLQPEAEKGEEAFAFERVDAPAPSQTRLQGKQKTLLHLNDLTKLELPWFDPRFDYMAYIALSEAQELHAIPRLSSRHRFQIAGCTMDDRFQIAEPIPSVYYQGFVIGLQAVSRNGLATTQELEQFGEQVNSFAEKMSGSLLLTDVETFLNVARPLDELCARVDQTIAMHLVSRGSISGTELRAAVENLGFELGVDGAFRLPNEEGEPLFTLVTLDNTPFTASLLSSQAYRGFSMLFDITHVPAGEK